MGSWTFVCTALVFLALWMGYNRSTGFDKYPFILLNLVLSCLAAMQGAILLIAAKRADQIAAELSMHTYRNTQAASGLLNEHNTLLTRNTELTEQVHMLVDHTLALAEHVSIGSPTRCTSTSVQLPTDDLLPA